MPEDTEFDFDTMRQRAGGFPPEAFEFVREGLAHTVRRVHGEVEEPKTVRPSAGVAEPSPNDESDESTPEDSSPDESHHVSGQQLCEGLRDYALQQYGRLALMVLHHWGVRETADFGRIVFAMVEAGLMRKTDEDSIDDFNRVFDFQEAFAPPPPVTKP